MLLNVERADRYLEERNINALVSSSRENTSYLTNFLAVNVIRDRLYNVRPGSGEHYVQAYGVYGKKGKSAVVLPSSYFMFMKVDSTVTCEVFAYGKVISLRDPKPRFKSQIERDFEQFQQNTAHRFDTAGEALVAAVKAYSSGKTLAVDMADMLPSTLKQLEKAQFQVKNATELFRFVRMVKSPEELIRLRSAATRNEKAMAQIFQTAKAGVSETELAKAYALSVLAQDGEFDNAMCPIDTKGGTMIGPTGSKLAKGSMFWVDVTSRFRGYYADTGESASLGAPSKKQQKYYDTLTKVVEKTKDILVPGMRPSELNNEVARIWDAALIDRSPTGMGHGIGLEVHEYPRISAAKGAAIEDPAAIKDDFIESSIDMPFEEGMVLNIEAPYLVQGWGGVHLEQTLVLGKNSCREITPQERRLRILR